MTRKPYISHGYAGTPEYHAWYSMIDRCTNPNHIHYRDYGGRGITVYEGWTQDPTPFIEYIGPRPSPQHSLDRKDNDKGYEPGNVHWATKSEQIKNQRSKHMHEDAGVRQRLSSGPWLVTTPRHPQTKKFKWLSCNQSTKEEAIKLRKEWLQANWPDYPKGSPLTVW